MQYNNVGEDEGTVNVCATLNNATVATERRFMITLTASDDTALGKYRSYLILSQVMIFTPCYTAGSDFDDTSMVLTFYSGAYDGYKMSDCHHNG